MRAVFVLVGLFACAAAKCSQYTDCGTCAGAKDGLLTCRWCVSDNSCYNNLQLGCPKVDRIQKRFDCPKEMDPAFAYDETFARKVVLPLIVASNGDEQQIQRCLDNNFADAKLFRQYTIKCDGLAGACSAYLAVLPKENAIVASFRGSKDIGQFLAQGTDFFFNILKPFAPTGGKVVSYFNNAFYGLLNAGMERDLNELRAAYPGYEFWAVGHSLGGSLATLATAYVVSKDMFKSEKVKMVSFGQPRTGDITFAESFENLVKYRYRIVHKEDMIPHLPARVFDNLVNSAFHHRHEVWYNNDMKEGDPHKMCLRADDDSCSESGPHLSGTDHIWYFATNLDEYHKTGCLA